MTDYRNSNNNDEEDFLDEDKEIRHQKYACVSFLSPEDILPKKEIFIIEKFLQHFSQEMRDLFSSVMYKYPDLEEQFRSLAERYEYIFEDQKMQDEYRLFTKNNEQDLNSEFSELVNFQTNVRGFKIRGSYESIQEAQIRCEVLKRLDKNKHDIYIVQVGCWCAWNPNPNDISSQEYANDDLNTLMKKKNENAIHIDEAFETRKQNKLNRQKELLEKTKMQNNMIFDSEFMRKKIENDNANNDENVDDEIDEYENANVDENVKIENNDIDKDNKIIENVGITENPDLNNDLHTTEDLWLKNKMKKTQNKTSNINERDMELPFKQIGIRDEYMKTKLGKEKKKKEARLEREQIEQEVNDLVKKIESKD